MNKARSVSRGGGTRPRRLRREGMDWGLRRNGRKKVLRRHWEANKQSVVSLCKK
jgi:hypothetical protein